MTPLDVLIWAGVALVAAIVVVALVVLVGASIAGVREAIDEAKNK